MSRFACSTLLPSTVRTDTLWSPSRLTNAVLPSGEKATALGPDRKLRSAPRSLGFHLLEHLGGGQHRLADDGHAHVAGEVEQHLGELPLGPAFLEGKAQMDFELGMPARRGVRDYANERARLISSPGASTASRTWSLSPHR